MSSMAANKFATMLDKNTNKITFVLIYAILEWVLIIFLLLNSLLSYLTIKFADYFGLKRPCLWCSRLDHIFEPENENNQKFYEDLVCEAHATQIPNLGFFSDHQKTCSCSSKTRRVNSVDFFIIDCNEKEQHLDLLPSRDGLDCSQNQNLITAEEDHGDDGEESEGSKEEEESEESSVCSVCHSSCKKKVEEERVVENDQQEDFIKRTSVIVDDHHLEFYVDGDEKLIPVGTVAFSAKEIRDLHERQGCSGNHNNQDVVLETNLNNSEEDPSSSKDDNAPRTTAGGEMGSDLHQDIYLETSTQTTNDHKALCFEHTGNEEERFPETPTSMENFHQLIQKKSLLVDEIEGGVWTIEELKSALRNERKALNALYLELEEERSASAIAANQTMAMINRLQEEKATVQMEALHYQRMMEEQSEYDQEALQILNELLTRRETEKEEVQNEMEMYRKRVEEYEAKHHRFCSGKELEFEEERLSILEHLKVLEEKLYSLRDEDGQCFEDVRSIEHFYKDNGIGLGNGNGHDYLNEVNGKQQHEDVMSNGEGKGLSSVSDSKSLKSASSKNLAIEDEVDFIYERLEALEADREFLKHCFYSLRKGDERGLHLLQDILQHMRSMRKL